MLCRFFQHEYCEMPIGPLPLWLQGQDALVKEDECSDPNNCACYEVKEKAKRTYPNPGMIKPLPVQALRNEKY